ncbi:MAG: flap endonuclease-1 [Candidatus Thermoplasmatota archaeon]|nr:flap endonuclease-1 [Candidatus Thermoplasmatota archaeon]
MGVDLGDLFKKEAISLTDLKNQVLLIDAYNVLHQFLSIIRQRDGTLLMDAQGRVTSHLSGLFQRTANLVDARIKPVFVFDGKPPALKEKILAERHARRMKAEKEWQEALEKGDMRTAFVKAQQTSRVTPEIVEQSKELLEALGIPWVQAPSEGEAQASYMVKKEHFFAVGSQDFDCLLFGTPVLVRNLTSSSRRKLPNKQAYAKIGPELIHLQQNLKTLGILQKQLIDMALLIGTDFNEGVKGIGPKKSLQYIKKNGNLENALATIGQSNAPTFSEIKELRELFLHPEVTDDYQVQWHIPDKERVLHILCDIHQFTDDRVISTLDKFLVLGEVVKQKNLFDF